jgi:hypothetical protein
VKSKVIYASPDGMSDAIFIISTVLNETERATKRSKTIYSPRVSTVPTAANVARYTWHLVGDKGLDAFLITISLGHAHNPDCGFASSVRLWQQVPRGNINLSTFRHLDATNQTIVKVTPDSRRGLLNDLGKHKHEFQSAQQETLNEAVLSGRKDLDDLATDFALCLVKGLVIKGY